MKSEHSVTVTMKYIRSTKNKHLYQTQDPAEAQKLQSQYVGKTVLPHPPSETIKMTVAWSD